MKYTVYQITNLVNNKIYVGVHQTTDTNDEYFSSSRAVKQAVKKYGKENFRKDILFVYDNPEEMFLKEKEIVNEEFVQRKDTYNITCGGIGSWHHWNDGSERHKESARKGAKKAGQNLQDYLRKNPDKRIPPPDWTGKSHSKESKRKISEANKIALAGEKNPNYGKVWCVRKNATEYTDRKPYYPDEIPEGWVSVKEHRDQRKVKNGIYGRKWYNDGENNFLLSGDDERINSLAKGRIGKLFQKNSV